MEKVDKFPGHVVTELCVSKLNVYSELIEYTHLIT